jgi:hypothetical protein
MARANFRLSTIFIVLMCLSPIKATPITISEVQKDNSTTEGVIWNSFSQANEIPKLLEIKKWEITASETPASKKKVATENKMTIPESESLILLGIGLAGIAALLKKKPQKLH